MDAMLGTMPEKTLKLQETRPGLLIRRLLRGREAWKVKYREAKAAIRAQRVRIRDLEASRQQWREIADRADNEKRDLEAALAKRHQDQSATGTESTAQKKVTVGPG